jgi:hypothetical protein
MIPRLTRFGAVIIAILVACAVLVVVASRAVQLVALVVGCLILLALAGEGVGSGFSAGDADRKREVLGRQARPRRRRRREPPPAQDTGGLDPGLVPRRHRDPD